MNIGFYTVLLKKRQLNDQKKTPEVFCKKAILKYFVIFTGKHLCWSLFLIMFIKKRLQHRCFLWILQNTAPILKNICEWLLVNDGNSLSWIKSSKPIIAQYDAQLRHIKRLIILLFLKAPLTILTWKNLYFTEFSTIIDWNARLAASDVFHIFTQSIKFF